MKEDCKIASKQLIQHGESLRESANVWLTEKTGAMWKVPSKFTAAQTRTEKHSLCGQNGAIRMTLA